MNLKLSHSANPIDASVVITGSKSETNRLLILEALFDGITIENLSNSDDASVMQKALASSNERVDIHHAGTAMRFLTAYFAVQPGRNTLLTGSNRMQERPIGVLVDALRSLGAHIDYEANEGYPPLRILGQQLSKSNVSLKADVSSQYISALMLIGASLPKGLEITLEGKITSVPYITMTLALLQQLGIQGSFTGQTIQIRPLANALAQQPIIVESDWSSASYFYSIVALVPGSSITLSSYRQESLQGDAVLQKIYQALGVTTVFDGVNMSLTSASKGDLVDSLELDLSRSPDIAQTIAVTCLGLGIGCHLTGLHTLKIKETDRLEALKTEIRKLGGAISVTNNSLTLEPQKEPLRSDVSIATYNDHRMAMAFAPLAVKTPIRIEDAGVVSKSYPDFWSDLKMLDFEVQSIINA
ncbi:MAG: 3-phosphoshikimate 1-carboxyvinyltransferase [Dokdonia sp.]|jgi:3-phosphoshikimate 1-carboxyvinyltransferase